MYTVDNTFGYCSAQNHLRMAMVPKSKAEILCTPWTTPLVTVHARIHLRMAMVPKSKAEILNSLKLP